MFGWYYTSFLLRLVTSRASLIKELCYQSMRLCYQSLTLCYQSMRNKDDQMQPSYVQEAVDRLRKLEKDPGLMGWSRWLWNDPGSSGDWERSMFYGLIDGMIQEVVLIKIQEMTDYKKVCRRPWKTHSSCWRDIKLIEKQKSWALWKKNRGRGIPNDGSFT